MNNYGFSICVWMCVQVHTLHICRFDNMLLTFNSKDKVYQSACEHIILDKAICCIFIISSYWKSKNLLYLKSCREIDPPLLSAAVSQWRNRRNSSWHKNTHLCVYLHFIGWLLFHLWQFYGLVHTYRPKLWSLKQYLR